MNNKTGALSGIKVVDLSRVLGGPYCTQALADHGAEVIKLEPLGGDETRGWGPPFDGDLAAYFKGVNRNKLSLAVDLSHAQGKDVLIRLLQEADVLVENFKPGTLERWGLGYDTLKTRFPGLIHCSITGFGADGPLGGLPGYDAVVQAMAGLMSVNGSQSSGPTRVGLPVVDLVTGLNALTGVLLALAERSRSGQGQHVDISLYDCGMSLLHPHVPNYLASGKLPKLTGNAHPNICPYDSYASGSVPVFLAIGNDGQFRKLCDFIGAGSLPDDERFANNAQRLRHSDALKALLEQKLAEHDGLLLAEQLMAIGVPCGAIADVQTVVDHPHTQHRQMIWRQGDYQGIGSPIKLSRTPPAFRQAPPQLGEHTLAVLANHGFDAEAIASLQACGVIPAQ
ncbi:CoA transferase [Pseudomonas putida]|uniref:CaiB/BaiF CoA transferase family protein n=1 Tax=Pseudomonas putida group TaxID=136845 RepID=UPI001059FC0F|nr:MULTISPECIES: CaiB/BaiF CoA-transferase family protein [Pseudomonas putida group]MBF8744656.1 CoA transferase [Pseudomonas monteilii]TDJ75418.1 CoA transferase [Pseudomonas putida]